MIQSQVNFGKQRIAEIANVWGVTTEKVAHILIHSREAWGFYEWVNADEFLEDELWRDE